MYSGRSTELEVPPASEASKGLMTSENGRTSSETRGAALYIASLAEELAQLAKSHDLGALAYILDMARLEADQISRRWSAPGGHNPEPT